MMTFLTSESASCVSSTEVLNLLNTDSRNGLGDNEVSLRRKLYSSNEFQVTKSDPLWKKYLEQVNFS
jgi:magnesium-transporting ATPase (P-type)